MGVADINGAHGKPPMYQPTNGGYPSMSPSMIGSTPAYQNQNTRATNNVIVSIGGEDDFKR
jgi:hypothetical protein